jgi:uncharacterized small protein (DUF1192 family)
MAKPEEQRAPWEQQTGESDLMYGRFRTYLDLGPRRTLAKVAADLTATGDTITVARLTQISSQYGWPARADAFDRRPPRPFRLGGDRDPWEQQEGESERMYSRFRTYLDLGRTRTLTQAAEILTVTGDDAKLKGAYIRSLSAQFLWTQRTGAFDRDQDRLEREQLIELRRDMIKRHRATANDLTAKAKAALSKLKTEKLTPLDVVRFLRLAAGIEATALGMPFETIAVTGAAGGALVLDDLSAYTPEERRERLAVLGAEIMRRSGAPVDDMTTED